MRRTCPIFVRRSALSDRERSCDGTSLTRPSHRSQLVRRIAIRETPHSFVNEEYLPKIVRRSALSDRERSGDGTQLKRPSHRSQLVESVNIRETHRKASLMRNTCPILSTFQPSAVKKEALTVLLSITSPSHRSPSLRSIKQNT